MYIYYIQSCSTWVAWGGIRRDRREGEENLHYYVHKKVILQNWKWWTLKEGRWWAQTDWFPVVGSKLELCESTWFSPSFLNDWMPQFNENNTAVLVLFNYVCLSINKMMPTYPYFIHKESSGLKSLLDWMQRKSIKPTEGYTAVLMSGGQVTSSNFSSGRVTLGTQAMFSFYLWLLVSDYSFYKNSYSVQGSWSMTSPWISRRVGCPC